MNVTKECTEEEVADELRAWRCNVCRVQIVPDVGNLADGNPVVTFVRNEALFDGQILLLIFP